MQHLRGLYVGLFGAGLTLWLGLGIFTVTAFAVDEPALQEEITRLATGLKEQTRQLFVGSRQLQQIGGSAHQAALLDQLMQLARRRTQQLAHLSALAPAQAWSLLLSEAIRNMLPEEVRQELEQPVTLTGQVEVLVTDDFERGQSEMSYVLRVGPEQVYTVRFVEPPALRSGDVVELRAWQVSPTDVLVGPFTHQEGTP